jgi:hypothetical protein
VELALVHSNKINKWTINVFNTPYIKVLQVLFRECFQGGIANQVDNQSDTKLQFNLNTFNACCTQVHKTKYSMNVQYPILGTLEIVWAPYHIFQQFNGHCIALPKPRRNAISSLG